MRPDVDAATERVVVTRTRLAELRGGLPATEIEDELCVGYARALEGDAWLARARERLRELADEPSSPRQARQLRMLTAEHGDVERGIIALRRALGELRHEFDRVRKATAA